MSRSRICHLYGDITIADEGLQNFGLCSALRAFEQGWIFIVPYLLVHRALGFSGLIRKTAPFSRLLRHTRGCGGPGPILTWILIGFFSHVLHKKLKYKDLYDQWPIYLWYYPRIKDQEADNFRRHIPTIHLYFILRFYDRSSKGC
jgi:hypothetical protein